MRFAPLVLAALCVLVLFTGLDRVGVLDTREARDAAVARELIARQEVFTPVLAGEPLYEKPVVAYAPEALAQALGPDAPRRARQMRGLIAVALLLVTATAGARHFGPRAGVFAAGVLLTGVALPLAARSDGTQLLGTLLAWVGCEGLADVVFGRAQGRDLRLVVTYGALAAALVCAGPLPALWPLGGLALYLALARDREHLRRARLPAGLLVMLGMALPWYGAMAERHGAAFLAHAPFFPYAAEPRGPWYAGPLLALSFLVVGCFPWSVLLPGAALHAATWWRARGRALLSIGPGGPDVLAGAPLERERREEGAAHFFIACLLASLVPVALYPAPPLTAVLPALPAAALLCGRLLDHLFEDAARVERPVAQATRMLAFAGSAAALLVNLLAARVREAAPELRLLATALFVTSWLPFLAGFMKRPRLAALLLALPVAAGAPVVSLRVLPAMEDWLNARSVAQAMEAVAPPRAPLVLPDAPPASLRYYLRRDLIVASPVPAMLREARAADGLAYLAFRPIREREVAAAQVHPLEILLRTPGLVLARVRPG